MTISKQNLLRQYASHTLIFAASFFLANLGICSEALPDELNSNVSKPKNLTDRASELAMQTFGMLGINYKYGGNTPENGLDCSGFVRYVYKEAWNTTLPRTSLEISNLGEKIKTQDLQPGDLVFFNTLKRKFSHVGIYLGEHKFIHSPSRGGQIRIESMDVKYWKNRFNGARRISDPEQKTATSSLSATSSTIELSAPVPY